MHYLLVLKRCYINVNQNKKKNVMQLIERYLHEAACVSFHYCEMVNSSHVLCCFVNWPYMIKLWGRLHLIWHPRPYVEERNVFSACSCFPLFRIVFFRKMQLFSFLEIKFQNGHLQKRLLFFDPPFTFSGHQTRHKTFFGLYLTYIHAFSLFLFAIFEFPVCINLNHHGFSSMWLLVLIRIPAILKKLINNKMVSKIYVGMCTTHMPNSIVSFKP